MRMRRGQGVSQNRCKPIGIDLPIGRHVRGRGEDEITHQKHQQNHRKNIALIH
jgi:hypothetical protein